MIRNRYQSLVIYEPSAPLTAFHHVVYAGSAEASWLWLFAYFVVITTGELYLSPIGLSLVLKVAPFGVEPLFELFEVLTQGTEISLQLISCPRHYPWRSRH